MDRVCPLRSLREQPRTGSVGTCRSCSTAADRVCPRMSLGALPRLSAPVAEHSRGQGLSAPDACSTAWSRAADRVCPRAFASRVCPRMSLGELPRTESVRASRLNHSRGQSLSASVACSRAGDRVCRTCCFAQPRTGSVRTCCAWSTAADRVCPRLPLAAQPGSVRACCLSRRRICPCLSLGAQLRTGLPILMSRMSGLSLSEPSLLIRSLTRLIFEHADFCLLAVLPLPDRHQCAH